MERRTGFAVAGAVSLILVAGAIAAGANLGLLGTAKDSPGKAATVTADPSPQVITVEVRDPAGSATAQVQNPASEPVKVIDVPVAASRSISGSHDDDEDEHGSEDGSEHEDEGGSDD